MPASLSMYDAKHTLSTSAGAYLLALDLTRRHPTYFGHDPCTAIPPSDHPGETQGGLRGHIVAPCRPQG